MGNTVKITNGKAQITSNGKALTLRSSGESKNYRVFANAKGAKPMFSLYVRKDVKSTPEISLKADGKTEFSNRFAVGKMGDKIIATLWTPFKAERADAPVGKTRKAGKSPVKTAKPTMTKAEIMAQLETLMAALKTAK